MLETRFTIVGVGAARSMEFRWHQARLTWPPTATCTLLEVGGHRMIVDPSPEPELLEAMLLAQTGLRPENIDSVFVTHYHDDHWVGAPLFPGRPWFIDAGELEVLKTQKPQYSQWFDRFVPADRGLPEGLELFPAPGHTMGTCAVKAQTEWGCLIVAGDGVHTPGHFAAGRGASNCASMALAAETLIRIKETADLVVPGHGNYFLNRRQAR